mmetsp:Transcript_80772/g.127589  ORF Transcript_80772/g.127589 Transcript_80772/m.127589 type:complete len:380 (+) Transcript_80772:108-1247(+)
MSVLTMDPRAVHFQTGPSLLAYPASVEGSYMTGGPMKSAAAPMGPRPYASRPQPLMDSDPADGPVSVAYGLKKELLEIRAKYPAPASFQYIHREASVLREKEIQQACHPSPDSDVCGWVMATADPNGAYGGDHPDNEEDRMNLKFDNFRLVFQCVSGTALLHWASEEDFKIGIFGARRAPRALAWWDLRKAYDVVVQRGDDNFDIAAGQFTILMYGGNLSFSVEGDQDIPIWYNAVRGVIRDAAWHQATKAEQPEQQRKRWHAAMGLARALLNGRPIGTRALAVTFHLYDTDKDCVFRLGEIMLLIKEVYAAMIQDTGLAEGATMDLALQSASSRIPTEFLFEKALIFRRQCDQSNDGRISKGEFAAFGHQALLEAVTI